jgi:HEAT repeat protein
MATSMRSTWEAWWHLNRHRFLDYVERRRRHRNAERSGPGSHFYGVPGKGNRRDAHDQKARESRDAILDALLVAARNPDARIAASALIAVGRSGEARAAPVLHHLSKHERGYLAVREAALLALGMLGTGGDGVRMALEAVVRDGRRSASERARAALGLGLFGHVGAVPRLMAMTRVKEARVDVAAMSLLGLGLLGDEIVVPDLAAGLSGRFEDASLRACAAAALAKLGSRAALPALLRALGDRDREVRRQVVLSLGAIARPDDDAVVRRLLILTSSERDSVVRGYAAVSLGEMGVPEAAAALIKTYHKGDLVEASHAALGLGLLASRAEASLRERILPTLRTALSKRKNPEVRAALLIALGLARDQAAVPHIRKVLGGKGTKRLRSHAAVALGLLEAEEAVPDLRDALEEKGDHVFQREVALGLGLIGDRAAADSLVAVLRGDSSDYVRGSAALALGYLVPPERATPLVEALADEKAPDTTRILAAIALGLVLEDRDVPVLSRLEGHLNPGIRVAVLRQVLQVH